MAGPPLWGFATDHVNAVAQIAMVVVSVVLAAIAIFGRTILGWIYRPCLRVRVTSAPPDCVAVPILNTGTNEIADSVFLRIRIENAENATATAQNVEVYAAYLSRQRADKSWEDIKTFPPMNLKWTDGGGIYFPRIAPGIAKPCDVAHITSPDERRKIRETLPKGLDPLRTALVFELKVSPNHLGHIVGPALYRLDIVVAAENARPQRATVEINLRGEWYQDQEAMLRDGVGISLVEWRRGEAPARGRQ